MKLKDGENTFRVLSSAITGWEYWNTGNRPVRSKERWLEVPNDIKVGDDGKPSKVKHFWAFVVYNYDEKMVQILEVTQVRVQEGIKALVDSKHWGNPKQYDISITRSGSGFETDYITQGIPPTPLDKKVLEEYQKLDIRLEALYTGEDPFGSTPREATPEPEAVDSPGFQEPTIEVKPEDLPPEPPEISRTADATPDRYKTVPKSFRPAA